MLNKLFKDRTIGFYLCLGAAVIALISSIIFIAVDYGDITFSTVAFVLMLIGALSTVAVIFTDFKFVTIIPVLFYSIALGVHVYTVVPSLTDLFTGVVFYGGNQGIAIAFTIIFAIATIAAIASSFMAQKKTEAI